MPGRLSPSPPVLTQASSSPEAMSLTETSRPVPAAHLFQPSASYLSDASSPWDPPQATTYNISQVARPQLRGWQPNEPGYNAFHHDPNRFLNPACHGRQRPNTPLSDTSPQSHQSLSILPAKSTAFVQYPGAGSSPLKPIAKQDDSEDLPHLKEALAALPSPSYRQTGPAAPLHKDLENAPSMIVPNMSPRSNSSRPTDMSSLIRYDSKFERNFPLYPKAEGYTSSRNVEYKIIIRQQPIAARACGFGERDRRVIDPPPILQMIVRDPRATPGELDSQMRYPFSVIHCELWNAELDHDETSMPETEERRQQRRLMGTLVASPFVGRDEFNVEGCFFPFADLSCRTTGRYRLKFVLVVLDPARMKPGDKLPFRATVLSDVFEVYPAKTFPGMVPSTELAKRLKDQGCLISVKKGHHKVERRNEARTSVDNEKEREGDDTDSPGREKRQRM